MDDIDRISQLPVDIAHHVLSFLKDSPKALVRMSVLSKYWFAITDYFPILHFDIDSFTRDIDSFRYDAKNMFFKYVGYTTSRLCNQQNIVHTFNLNRVLLQEPWKISIVDRCIRLIVRKGGLQVFRIDIETINYHLSKYRLPNIILSLSSLSSLIIQNCDLPSSLMVDDAIIKFTSLKFLCLESVNINEQVINNLTTCCPLLENIVLIECYGFKRFCIYGCQNLQKVSLYISNEVERIDIDAPNLWYLLLVDWGQLRMNLSSCKKLTTLYYRGHIRSTDFLSNFPYIENLVVLPYLQHNLKLSSHSLKTLVLSPCCDLDAIDIDAPNLVLLKFSTKSTLSELLVRNSAMSEVEMELFHPGFVNALWFNKLRRFLSKKTGFFKVLKLKIYSSYIDVEELKAIDYPHFEFNHVEVELKVIGSELATREDESSVVDAVLWCLRPQSLTLKSDFYFLDFERRCRFVKFTYEKLLQQNDEGRTDFQIELSIFFSKAKKQYFNDLNSLLAALPHDPVRHIITLTKVEGTWQRRIKLILHTHNNSLFRF